VRGDTDSSRKKGRTNSHALAGGQAGRVSSVTTFASNARALSVCLSFTAKSRAARPDTSPYRCQNKQSGHTTGSGNVYVMMSRTRRASLKPLEPYSEERCAVLVRRRATGR
jgi:hypothetical protein